MKISKVQIMAAALISMLLLGGCGDVPYQLTEREENIIVDYSAHIVTKYNIYQKEGLVYVNMEEQEPQNTQEETPPAEISQQEDMTQASGGAGTAPEPADVQQATLGELFGQEGISVTYTGVQLNSSYAEDTYYDVSADAGKVYLIMGIDITNMTGNDVYIDNLAASPRFKVTVNDTISEVSAMTVLTDDFSAYQDTVQAGSSKSAVLLFTIPDTVTEIGNLALEVTMHDVSYQIIL